MNMGRNAGSATCLYSLFLTILFSGCQPADTVSQPTGVHIAATTQAVSYAERLVGAYRQLHPFDIKEGIQILPEAQLWKALENGDVQAILYLDDSSPQDYWTASLGWTALSFVVPLVNPVKNLSTDQIQDIYQGRIDDWLDLDGKAGTIARYSYVAGSDMERIFEKFVLNGGIPAPDVFAVPGIWAMNLALEEDSSGLGYMRCIDVDPLKLVSLTINGVQPDYQHAKDGSYPYSIPLLISAAKDPGDIVKQFAGWSQSESGQANLQRKCGSEGS